MSKPNSIGFWNCTKLVETTKSKKKIGERKCNHIKHFFPKKEPVFYNVIFNIVNLFSTIKKYAQNF